MHAVIDLQLLLIAKRGSDVRLHLVVEGSWGVIQRLYIVSLLCFITWVSQEGWLVWSSFAKSMRRVDWFSKVMYLLEGNDAKEAITGSFAGGVETPVGERLHGEQG